MAARRRAVGVFGHRGRRNFIVTTYGDDGRDGLVNEIGPYDGRVPMSGPAFVEVMADGEWSVTVG